MNKKKWLLIGILTLFLLIQSIAIFGEEIQINLATLNTIYLNSSGPFNLTSNDLTCIVNATSEGENINYNGFWYKNSEQWFYEWNQSVDTSRYEDAYDIAVDNNDSIILTGYTNSVYPYYKDSIWILKFNSSGALLWNETYGGLNSKGKGIVTDSNNSIIITGYGSYVLAKYDTAGVIVWNKQQPIPKASGKKVAIDSSDNITMVGTYTNSQGTLLAKFNSSGNLQWNINLTEVASSPSYAWDIAIDSENNIVIVGTNQSVSAYQDIKIVKLDSVGTELWNVSIDGGSRDYGKSVAIDSDDNIIVTAETLSYGTGDLDIWTLKYNSSGSQLWNAIIESGDILQDEVESVAIDSQDNVIISGKRQIFEDSYYYHAWTIKYDSSGNLVWNKTRSVLSSPWGIAIDSQDNIIIGGGDAGGVMALKYYGFNLSAQNEAQEVLVDTLNQSYTTTYDNWTCQVRAFNGTNYTAYDESSLIVNGCGGSIPCSCEDEVTNDLTMTGNLNCSAGGLTIDNSNLTINCQGNYINGSLTGFGINNSNYNNLTIKNCNITNFGTGIYLNSSVNNSIINNTIQYNNVIAINITSSSANTEIINNTLCNNTLGITNLSAFNATNNNFCINIFSPSPNTTINETTPLKLNISNPIFSSQTNCSVHIDNIFNTSIFSVNDTSITDIFLNLLDGIYTWYVNCSDIYSNYGNSSNYSITIDRTPVVALTPQSASISVNTTVAITCNATDGTGNLSVNISVHRPSNNLNFTSEVAYGNSINYNLTNITGTYNVVCNVTDSFGNVGTNTTTFVVPLSYVAPPSGSEGSTSGDSSSEPTTEEEQEEASKSVYSGTTSSSSRTLTYTTTDLDMAIITGGVSKDLINVDMNNYYKKVNLTKIDVEKAKEQLLIDLNNVVFLNLLGQDYRRSYNILSCSQENCLN